MANQRARRTFTAAEAPACAHDVVHHDPATPRSHSLLPENPAAAAAGVIALSNELDALPASIRNALANAESSAGHISEDRLQGLAELIQNADDLGATSAEFFVDERRNRLLFRHNGEGLSLHDVWALAIPWLSLKVDDPDQLGRFGIGLKTLHALSDILDVHQADFHVRYEAHGIAAADPDPLWPSELESNAMTTFVVPFDPAATTYDAVASWLIQWGDAGLVFLSHLNSVALHDSSGDSHSLLQVKRTEPELVTQDEPALLRRVVTASDSAQWVVYSRRVPVPSGRERARKAQGTHTPVALAFPTGFRDTGHLHIGLPVRPIGLPFRILAQFDPLTSRRDISDDEWNHGLVEPIADLWVEASLDHFRRHPGEAWAIVPLSSELDADHKTTGEFRTHLDTHFMTAARTAFSKRLKLPDNSVHYHLAELSYEVPELSGVLMPDDIRLVGETPGTISSSVRSEDDRWREVLGELYNIDAESAVIVEVRDTLTLLDDETRPIEFVADLVAVAIEADAQADLEVRGCLVLADGTRMAPTDAIGLSVLLPKRASDLWASLGIGHHLHPTFRHRDGWKIIRDWLRSEGHLLQDATNAAALTVLAGAGDEDGELPETLTDNQAESLRAAFEQLEPTARQAIGPGVGRAVRFVATTYDSAGKRVTTAARPCEAYIIERESNTWRVAAGTTPGLLWLHSRYSEKLRAQKGGDGVGVGAQRLFRLLGAETAPRLIDHPASYQRYASSLRKGVDRNAPGSPKRRHAQMVEANATYTLGDLSSPDLDAVLARIAAEKKAADRVRRAIAVLQSLNRAWDRLEPSSRVRAAYDYNGWQHREQIDAWWISSAASIAWLTSGAGAAAEPDHLRVHTNATEALFGNDRAQYLDDRFDAVAYRDVLAPLGVQGDPRPDQLVSKLKELRDEGPADYKSAADLAAPLYRALAAQVQARGSARSTGSINLGVLRAEFGKGHGLVATNVGWRRPAVAFSGPEVFGAISPFVPGVDGTDALWDALGIRPPGPAKAKEVLSRLARRPPNKDELMVMLYALRILTTAPKDQLGRLNRSSVWVGDRWTATRPVYAVSNPLIAAGLTGQIPMWQPGGSMALLDSLIEPYGLTRVAASHARVRDPDSATYDPELTKLFASAVSNLRADLALSDPATEASIQLSWEELAQFGVCVIPQLTVTLPNFIADSPLSFGSRAWIDAEASTFFVADTADISSPETGAYAVATMFDADTRRIAHDWLAAWAGAEAGHRAEAIKTAAALEAEQKRERAAREAEAGAALQKLSQVNEKRRSRSKRGTPTEQPTAPNASGSETTSTPKPPRTLVDLSTLVLTNPAGELIAAGGGTPTGGGTKSGKKGSVLQPPDKDNPKKKRQPGSGKAPRNYTPEEQETLGADICRWVLGLDLHEIVDIRNQHNVGADAVDKLDNFYEYKVHAGPIPDVIKLEPSQIERARTTENFFLVVIGNLESGNGDPEVRIITNPLDQLVWQPTASEKYSGVHSARALKYWFSSDDSAQDPDGA